MFQIIVNVFFMNIYSLKIIFHIMDNEAHKFFLLQLEMHAMDTKSFIMIFQIKKMILRKILMQISDSQKRFRRPPNFNGLLF